MGEGLGNVDRMKLQIFISILSFGIASQGLADEVSLLCTSKENPSTLYININTPEAGDDCDISYNDDCGRTIGNYVLNTDLSLPQAMETSTDKRENFTDNFNEAEENGLEISHSGRFSLHFSSGFRQELTLTKKTAVQIVSYETVRGSGAFQLICVIR